MKISELFRNEIGKDQVVYPADRPRRSPNFSWKIGSGYDVYYSPGEFSKVRVFDGKTLVARVGFSLLDSPDTGDRLNNIQQAGMAEVKKAYQGQNLGLELYRNLIVKENWIISGFDHSTGARKLWTRLSTQPEITVYAYNPDWDWDVAWHIPTIKGNELSLQGKNIYDSDQWHLIAVHKNGAADQIITKDNPTLLKKLKKKSQIVQNA